MPVGEGIRHTAYSTIGLSVVQCT